MPDDPFDFGSGRLDDWCNNPVTTSKDKEIVSADIWLLGDSIAAQAYPDLRDRLGAHRVCVATNSQGARPTQPTVDVLEQWLAKFPAPRLVVMACGSNDIFDPRPVAAQIDRTMRMVGTQAPVLWKDVQVCRTGETPKIRLADQRNTGRVNAQIHASLTRHPGLHLIPWFQIVASQPGSSSLLEDGVHLSDPEGIQAHNDLILRKVLALF